MVLTLSAAGSKCARISASAAGRATTAVAEQKCREMNVVSIGLTVFGSNKAAQTLYRPWLQAHRPSDVQTPLTDLTEFTDVMGNRCPAVSLLG